MTNGIVRRREMLRTGGAGFAAAAAVGAVGATAAREAAAQAPADSLLRTVLDRGHVLVGTGSTNAPWHFENEAGELVGISPQGGTSVPCRYSTCSTSSPSKSKKLDTTLRKLN